MVGLPPARDDEDKLTGARSEFVASLPRRVEVLRAGLAALAESPGDRDRRNGLLRRLHALSSAARVLGFVSVAEVLGESERSLRRAGQPSASVIRDVSRALDVLPSLMLGAPLATSDSASVERAPGRSGPLGVLLYGAASLGEGLESDASAAFELTRAEEDAAAALTLARSTGPDAAIIDADRRGSRELLEGLRGDDLIAPIVIVVVGTFGSPEVAAAYVAAGADRVVPKPASPEVLRRALLELREGVTQTRTPREPVGELSVEELAERIASEVKRGLTESVELGGKAARISFGDGADVLGAVWGAVARVRELVTLRSAGNVRFQPVGPEGAVPLAPWMGEERRAGERGARSGRGAEDVGLKGRRVVVADDDPAVVWFLSGLLKAVGAEVIEAHDGERALERTFETWPDLVVSDVLMPRRDGFSLCHEIKRDVVVRDVPVILLSWKEDLLQRVRELGAGADGYLRKEAAASTVIERVREVLRPRARIEQRLRVGGEVRGRLDGLTPRLILELLLVSRPDAKLSIRDAVYLYEAQVRGGRLKSLSRSASDGSFERGSKVLTSLLGVSAGRFVVEPNSSPCRTEFDAPLNELLAEPVRRARGALSALAAQKLSQVVGVDVDLEAAGGYFSCTPESAKSLIERLSAGGSPRQMLLTGEVSAWLLEAVLSDLARRGAIRSVEHDTAPLVPGGSQRAAALAGDRSSDPFDASADPLTTAQAFSEPPPARAADSERAAIDSAWSEPPARAPGAATVTRASEASVTDGAVRVAAIAAGGATLAATVPGGAAEASRALPRSNQAPSEEDGWFSFQVDATATRDVPRVQPVPAHAGKPPAHSSSTPLGLGPTQTAPGGPVASQAAAPAPSNDSLEGLTISSAPPPTRVENPQRPGVRPVLRLDAVREQASPNMADVFAAALEEAPSEVAPSQGLAAAEPNVTEPKPVATAPIARAVVSVPRPAPASPRAPAVASPPEPSAPVAPSPMVPVVSSPAAPVVPAQVVSIDPAPLRVVGPSAADAGAVDVAPSPSVEAPSPRQASGEDDRATPESGAPPAVESNAAPVHEAARAPERAAQVQAEVRRPRAESRGGPPPPPVRANKAVEANEPSKGTPVAAKDGIGRTILLVVLAFAGAFLLVDRVIVPRLAPRETVAPLPPPSALVAKTRASAAVPAAPTLKLEALGIPAGVELGAGRGLIDVVGQEGDALYVDGTFVGRGPGRSVPLAAGSHEVRITRGDATQSLTVELAAGKRLRVSLPPSARPRPSP